MKTDTRSDIMQAALELLVEQGFHGAPMAQIAKRAEVAAGTIYCHFENREALIHAVVKELEMRINGAIVDDLSPEMPTRHRFVAICRELLHYLIVHPLEFRYLEQFHNSPFGAKHRREQIFGTEAEPPICRELFERGIAEGVIKDLPVVLLYGLTFGPLIIVVRDHILGEIVLDERLIEQVVDACWDAVRR